MVSGKLLSAFVVRPDIAVDAHVSVVAMGDGATVLTNRADPEVIELPKQVGHGHAVKAGLALPLVTMTTYLSCLSVCRSRLSIVLDGLQ